MTTTKLEPLRAPPAPNPGGQTMTAIVQDRYGPAPEGLFRVAEIDRPAIGDGEVLVRVHAASVDRGTWHIMAGLPYPIRLAGFGLRRPKYANPGRSLAGTVEAVGAGVTGFAPGDEVFGIGDGTFAEYATARADKLARKPANLTFEQAAAVPVSGVTALQAVRDHGRVQAGQQGADHRRVRRRGHASPCRSRRRSAPRSPACAARRRSTWCAPSAPTTSSTTPARTSPTAVSATTSSSTSGATARLSRLRRALTPRGRLVIVGGETDGRLARRQQTARSGPSCCPRSSARSWAPSSPRRTPPT